MATSHMIAIGRLPNAFLQNVGDTWVSLHWNCNSLTWITNKSNLLDVMHVSTTECSWQSARIIGKRKLVGYSRTRTLYFRTEQTSMLQTLVLYLPHWPTTQHCTNDIPFFQATYKRREVTFGSWTFDLMLYLYHCHAVWNRTDSNW